MLYTSEKIREARAKAARARRRKFRDAFRGFPRPLLEALNAKQVADEGPNHFLEFLSLFHSPRRRVMRTAQVSGTTLLTRRILPPQIKTFPRSTTAQDAALAEWLNTLPDVQFRVDSVGALSDPRHRIALHATVATLRMLANALIQEKSPRGRGAKSMQAQAIGVFRSNLQDYAKELKREQPHEECLDTWTTLVNCEAAIQVLLAFFELPPDSLSLLSRCDRAHCRRYFLRRSYTAQKICEECKAKRPHPSTPGVC